MKKKFSRQYRAQVRNRANGMCGGHAHRVICAGGMCRECWLKERVRRNPQHPEGPRHDKAVWAKVDFGQTNRAIAETMGVSITAARYQREKHTKLHR